MVIPAFVISTSAPSVDYQLWRNVIIRELNIKLLKNILVQHYGSPEIFVDYICLLENEIIKYRSYTSNVEIVLYYNIAYQDVVEYVFSAVSRLDMSKCSYDDIRYIDRWAMMYNSIDLI